jgi:hypothetical protein
MNTVTVGRGNYGRIFFVLAALGALYFYRRQGGDVRGLVSRGTGLIRSGRDFIATRAPSVTQSAAPSATI